MVKGYAYAYTYIWLDTDVYRYRYISLYSIPTATATATCAQIAVLESKLAEERQWVMNLTTEQLNSPNAALVDPTANKHLQQVRAQLAS